ncbi:MAG TPA: hypothetical protein PKC18_10415, partial [Lacipirellulaceae bacterium]|nr:hypothetical protein [Lacipirellulaceae bacterium]
GDRDHRSPYGPANIRFTVSKDGRALYVIQMGKPRPGDRLVLESFAADGPGAGYKIANVVILGAAADQDPINWVLDESGLSIAAPAVVPDELAVVYKLVIDPH